MSQNDEKIKTYIHTGTAGWAKSERARRALVAAASNHVRFTLTLAANWLAV